MKVLAVDQSYTSSGIVVLQGKKILHCERFVTNKQGDIFDRAHELADRLVSLVRNVKPDIVAVEGLAYGARGNASRDLAGLQFVIVSYLRDQGYRVKVIAPTTAKKTAGCKKKEEMIAALPKAVHKKFSDLGVKKTTGMGDLADAYWIGKSI